MGIYSEKEIAPGGTFLRMTIYYMENNNKYGEQKGEGRYRNDIYNFSFFVLRN